MESFFFKEPPSRVLPQADLRIYSLDVGTIHNLMSVFRLNRRGGWEFNAQARKHYLYKVVVLYGPGDVINISAPDVCGMQNKRVYILLYRQCFKPAPALVAHKLLSEKNYSAGPLRPPVERGELI